MVLAAEGLTKRFGTREALRGVSFSAARGELVAVIGPNGAGKTTLLSILAGIQRADEGRVHAPGEVGWGAQPPRAQGNPRGDRDPVAVRPPRAAPGSRRGGAANARAQRPARPRR